MGNKASTPNPYAAQCKYALNVPLCEYLAKEAGAAPDPTHNVEDDIYSGGALIQDCRDRVDQWLTAMDFPDENNSVYNTGVEVCSASLANAKGTVTATQFFTQMGITHPKYNPKGGWRDQVLQLHDTRFAVNQPPLQTTANKKQCMHDQSTNKWLTVDEVMAAPFEDPSSEANSSLWWSHAVMACDGDVFSGGPKLFDLVIPEDVTDSISLTFPYQDIMSLRYPNLPQDVMSLRFPGQEIMPIRFPDAHFMPLEDPGTQLAPDGYHYWIDADGNEHRAKPDPNNNVVPDDNPSDVATDMLAFEAFLANFGWTPEAFFVLLGTIPVVGLAAWEYTDRPILYTTVYAAAGFISRWLWYEARVEYYTVLDAIRNKYEPLLYAAAPAGITVAAIAAEMAIGVPQVIEGYTFLFGAGITLLVFLWKELQSTPFGKALDFLFSPAFSFLSDIMGNVGKPAST